ncbi:TniQ family protein [Peribacillus frigoritolerans]|uniref:TniQ family protein n=1 Tax=Peribacillus frigoritolerans TaxID=450367 RepID=UPI0038065559
MGERFSVRPKIKSGESLTSFLLRVCIDNSVTIKELFNEIKTSYKQPDLRNAHQIDFNPLNTIDVKLLVSLTDLDVNCLNLCTFNGLISHFISCDETRRLNNSSTLIKDLFTVKKRNFCPGCLQENIYYKLIWQVKDILTCPSHNIPLTSLCPECGKEQPYLHMNLAEGTCCYCCSSLTKTQNFHINNESLMYSQWLSNQWDDLAALNPATQTKQIIIATKLLYVCGNLNKHFSIQRGDNISRDYQFKLLRIVANKSPDEYGIGLNILLRTLWRLDYSIKDFFSITIPLNFSNSLTAYLNKNSFIKCIVPWCRHRDSNEKLIRINTFRAKTHHSLHICLGCCIKFGVNKKRGQWEEYGDQISIGYQTILPLINSGVSKLGLSKITGLSRYKIYKLTSYFARFGLINNEYLSDYIPENQDVITTEDILLITNRNETIMRDAAKNRLKIGINNFYFFYYDPTVQENIYNQE